MRLERQALKQDVMEQTAFAVDGRPKPGPNGLLIPSERQLLASPLLPLPDVKELPSTAKVQAVAAVRLVAPRAPTKASTKESTAGQNITYFCTTYPLSCNGPPQEKVLFSV